VECVEGGSIFDWAEAPLIYEYEHYNEFHKKRLAIRSGITGLWQVSGKSSLSFKQMVMLDVRYINEDLAGPQDSLGDRALHLEGMGRGEIKYQHKLIADAEREEAVSKIS